MDSDSFADVRLSAATIRARARQGGPLGGASAVLVGQPAATRRRPAVRRPHRGSAAGDHQLYLVIEAPTWSLRRRVDPHQERGARQFAAAVNAAARRADAAAWWPTLAAADS